MNKTCKPNGQVSVPATATELLAFLTTHVTENLNYIQAAVSMVDEAYRRNPAVRGSFADQDAARHGVDALVYSVGEAIKYAHQVAKAHRGTTRRRTAFAATGS